jgi:hypothetical protein
MRIPLSLWTTSLSILLLSCLQPTYGQRKIVVIDPDSRKMNQGNALPAQTYFDLQVPVSNEIGIIQVQIHKGRSENNLVEKTSWSRPMNFRSNLAEIPVDIQLKSNTSYTFDVTIYSLLNDSDKVHLHAIVRQNISNYLNAAYETTDKGITAARKSDQVLNDLNSIVVRSLKDLKSLRDTRFEGFSDIVKLKLLQVDNARLSNAVYNIDKRNTDTLSTDTTVKADYAVQLMEELESIIVSEIDNYLDTDFVKLYDKLVIRNQVTERTQTVLPLFIGYGAVYLGGNVDNLEYDARPYAGFSIPFGRGNGAWFSRTSFVLGVFINNFKDADDNVITGPVVDRPVFAGLGFRIYDFIHFNAGVVATSTAKQNLSNIKTENIDLRPFVGINAQFNLWLGLNKKQ